MASDLHCRGQKCASCQRATLLDDKKRFSLQLLVLHSLLECRTSRRRHVHPNRRNQCFHLRKHVEGPWVARASRSSDAVLTNQQPYPLKSSRGEDDQYPPLRCLG